MSYLLGLFVVDASMALDTLTAAPSRAVSVFNKPEPKRKNRALSRVENTRHEAAESVGEELIKACVDLNIDEISTYDRNGLARGECKQAFEIAIALHGFLPR